MQLYKPERIFVERAVQDSPITRRTLEQLRHVPVDVIDEAAVKLQEAQTRSPSIPRAKKSLVLCRHKGRFFKPCPGSQVRGEQRNACCNYFVINYASNCHMECSYCYLQSYLNFPYMVVYANVDELLDELSFFLHSHPEQLFRVGTGELADSLALDPLTGYSEPLVHFFARRPNAILEFKTKSDCVERLMDLEHRGKTVVSWSLNPPFIQQHEEHKTASVGARLAAARRCAEKGYPVAFHFDPLVHYPAWEDDYRSLVGGLFDRVPVDSIAWISLGTLRMTTALKHSMQKRFPTSFLPLGELVPCPDGKLRYFKPIRVEMYRKMIGWISAKSPATKVYTCMEPGGVWTEAFGSAPPGEVDLGDSLVQVVL